jgi:hypothetical protein
MFPVFILTFIFGPTPAWGIPQAKFSKEKYSQGKDLKTMLVDSVFCGDSEYDISFHTCPSFWNQNTLNTFQNPNLYQYPQDEVSEAEIFSSIFLYDFVAL